MDAAQQANLIRQEPAAFRAKLTIEANGQPVQLADVVNDWQAKDFAALDGGLQVAAGVPVTQQPVYRRAYLERGRGHGKTSDIAILVSWLLYSPDRKLAGVAAAADKDQARLVLDAIETLCRLNPPLAQVFDVQRNVVTNTRTGSQVQIISSDADTSYGLLVDFVICDELTHWELVQGEQLFHSLLSSAAKKENCLLVIISNAGRGRGESWQWNVREGARQSKDWYFSRLKGPQASWISPAMLDEQSRFLPPQVYSRLWLNNWTSGTGDCLSESVIRDAITLTGPMRHRVDGWSFVAGLDLSTVADHSALVVLGCEQGKNQICLASCESWKPPIDLATVEQAVVAAHRKFQLQRVVYDPWQCELLAQNLRRRGIVADAMHFSGANLHAMAATLLQVFSDHMILLYDDPALIRDLQRITITEKSYGWRLDSVRDSGGHADRAIALSIALPAASKLAHYRAQVPTLPARIAQPRSDPFRFGILLSR